MSGVESTPQTLDILYRWDGPKGQADRETYDIIFDAGIFLSQQGEIEEAGLLMTIVNSWERTARSVPVEVLAKALDMAEAVLARKAIAEEFPDLFPEVSKGEV